MAVAVAQLPALRLRSPLEVLRRGIARGRVWVPLRPVVADGAEAVRAVVLGMAQSARCAGVVGDAAVVRQLWRGRAALLRVQRGRQRIDLALELRNATVRLLLPLARGRGGDAVARQWGMWSPYDDTARTIACWPSRTACTGGRVAPGRSEPTAAFSI